MSIKLSAAISLAFAGAVVAQPALAWGDIFLASPAGTSSLLRVSSSTTEPHAAIDSQGNFRLALLDGTSINSPDTLRLFGVDQFGIAIHAPVQVSANLDPVFGRKAELRASSSLAALTYREANGRRVKVFDDLGMLSSDIPLPATGPQMIASAPILSGGAVLLSTTGQGSIAPADTRLERYTSNGMLMWSSPLPAHPTGAISRALLGVNSSGDTTVSFISKAAANPSSNSRRSNFVLTSFDFSATGTLTNSRIVDIEDGTSALTAGMAVADNGTQYLAYKVEGNVGGYACGLVRIPNGSATGSVVYGGVIGFGCNPPERLGVNDSGASGVFSFPSFSYSEMVRIDAIGGVQYVVPTGDNSHSADKSDTTILTDGRVVSIYATPSANEIFPVLYDQLGVATTQAPLPELVEGGVISRSYDLSATADGAYIVAYNSYDPNVTPFGSYGVRIAKRGVSP